MVPTLLSTIKCLLRQFRYVRNLLMVAFSFLNGIASNYFWSVKICSFQLIFGMAAMPFLCNGLLLNQLNLAMVNQVFTSKFAKVHKYYGSSPIPYFNFFYFYWAWPSFVLYILLSTQKLFDNMINPSCTSYQ